MIAVTMSMAMPVTVPVTCGNVEFAAARTLVVGAPAPVTGHRQVNSLF